MKKKKKEPSSSSVQLGGATPEESTRNQTTDLVSAQLRRLVDSESWVFSEKNPLTRESLMECVHLVSALQHSCEPTANDMTIGMKRRRMTPEHRSRTVAFLRRSEEPWNLALELLDRARQAYRDGAYRDQFPGACLKEIAVISKVLERLARALREAAFVQATETPDSAFEPSS